jgi:hypothetical protein
MGKLFFYRYLVKLKEQIKDFVSDWHWDEKSEIYAFESGKFLFSFMRFLESKNLSERTIKSHEDNIYFIGMFDAGYGYHEEFVYENFEDGPDYLYEYKRKVSDSKYAIQSYKSTWKKLDKYIKSGEFEKFLAQIEEAL